MRHEQVPKGALESLGMLGYVNGVDGWNQNTRIRHLSRKTTIPAHDSDNAGANGSRVFQSLDQVGAHVLPQIAATDGEYQNGIFLPQAATGQPSFENASPTFVIRAGGQLRYVVSGRVGFHARDLTEIVHGMRCVGRASSYSENEKPAMPLPGVGKYGHSALNLASIETLSDLPHFREIFPDECQTAVRAGRGSRYAWSSRIPCHDPTS